MSSAFPSSYDSPTQLGLSKREYIATAVAAAISGGIVSGGADDKRWWPAGWSLTKKGKEQCRKLQPQSTH